MTKRQGFYLLAGFLLFGGLMLPPTTLAVLFPNDQLQPFDLQTSFPLFLIMSAAFFLVALLFSAGLRIYKAGVRITAMPFFALGAFLLAVALYNFYWLTVWDSTYDGLGYLWLFFPVLGVFLAASWWVSTLAGRAKVAGLFYLLLLPVVLMVISGLAQDVDFERLTADRAERISQALETFYLQEGYYPENLQQLTPRYLFSRAEPVIIFGQDWCYDGSREYYRLGYVYRQHWSDPRLVGRIHRATNGFGAGWPAICQEEISALQARDPQYYQMEKK